MDEVEMRFWPKVQKTETCWLFTAARTERGYGCFTWDGRTRGAHRYSYELANGPILVGLEIDHLCRVPACVRPDHLEAVTHAENVRRASKAQQTECIAGHAFDEDNTSVRPNDTRACRTCQRRRALARHYAKKAVA